MGAVVCWLVIRRAVIAGLEEEQKTNEGIHI